MEFRILGPVEVVDDGQPLALPAAKPRELLALLLLRANRLVRTDTLVVELWGERAPATATKTVQVYVSQLRKVLGDRLETRPGGYLLRVEEGALDADRFERLVAEGRPAEALALWRGAPLADVPSDGLSLGGEVRRLEELRLTAVEERIELELELGGHARLVGELEQLVAAHPLRERLLGQLMLALYRSGRQAEALEAYRVARERLVEELGLEPGRELQVLEQAILRHDRKLQRARPEVVEPYAARPRRSRRVPAAIAAVVVVAGIVAGFVFARHDRVADPRVGVFVVKVENLLAQSREGRLEVSRAVSAAVRCKLAPRAAATRIEDVERNRQSLLQQIAALEVPPLAQARVSADLLQRALGASIAVDSRLRRALVSTQRCPPPLPPLGDGRATGLKRAFTGVFNPLARKFDQPQWNDTDF